MRGISTQLSSLKMTNRTLRIAPGYPIHCASINTARSHPVHCPCMNTTWLPAGTANPHGCTVCTGVMLPLQAFQSSVCYA